MIVVIDHFDSFVETLARYIAEAGFVVQVIRQDSTPEAVLALDPQAVVFVARAGAAGDDGADFAAFAEIAAQCAGFGYLFGPSGLGAAFGRHGRARSRAASWQSFADQP